MTLRSRRRGSSIVPACAIPRLWARRLDARGSSSDAPKRPVLERKVHLVFSVAIRLLWNSRLVPGMIADTRFEYFSDAFSANVGSVCDSNRSTFLFDKCSLFPLSVFVIIWMHKMLLCYYRKRTQTHCRPCRRHWWLCRTFRLMKLRRDFAQWSATFSWYFFDSFTAVSTFITKRCVLRVRPFTNVLFVNCARRGDISAVTFLAKSWEGQSAVIDVLFLLLPLRSRASGFVDILYAFKSYGKEC